MCVCFTNRHAVYMAIQIINYSAYMYLYFVMLATNINFLMYGIAHQVGTLVHNIQSNVHWPTGLFVYFKRVSSNADYIFDYLTILVAIGGFSLVSTFHQALKYTFKVCVYTCCVLQCKFGYTLCFIMYTKTDISFFSFSV